MITLWPHFCQLKKRPNISVWIMSWQLSQKVMVDISMPPCAMRGTRGTCWCRQWSIGCTCYRWRRQLFKYGRRPTLANDHDWLKIVGSQARTYHTETSEAGPNYHESMRNCHYTTRITVCSHLPDRFQWNISKRSRFLLGVSFRRRKCQQQHQISCLHVTTAH